MRHPRRFRPTLPALLALAASGSALCPRPARAIILPSAGSKEADAALEAKSHQDGQALAGVALIKVGDAGDEYASGAGTGIYLGPARDGRTGQVLTAAHVLVGDLSSSRAIRSSGAVEIQFGARADSGDAVAVPATRVVVHPDYFTSGWSATGDLTISPFQMHHDLALIEFDLAACGKDLERLGVRAIPLHESKDAKEPLREATVAGFGLYGHPGRDLDATSMKVHAGPSWVSYLTVDGHPGFHAWVPLKGWTMGTDPYEAPGFVDLTPVAFRGYRTGAKAFPVRVHDRQAVGMRGDSGGPLLLPVEGKGLGLAGVFAGIMVEEVTHLKTGVHSPMLRQYFVAVADNLDWIRALQKGEYGDATAAADETKAGAGESKSDAGPGQAAGAVETKVSPASAGGETQA